MYLSSQLSLRLHGSHSYHSYPLLIRSGRLIDALGPELARREVDPDNGNLSLWCAGFNDRNLGPRATPCDQDYLRKLAKSTTASELEDWYNRHVASLYHDRDAYEAEGLFVGDGSYLFVPDNNHYEGSKRLWFDEHNHPVSKEHEAKMTPAQRQRCRWRRCYRVVFLLHSDRAGERFVVAGVRTDIEERHRQVKCFWDLTRFHSTAWIVIVTQVVFVALTYSLLQLHLLQQGHEELNRRTLETTRRLLLDGNRVILYRQQYFAFLTVLEHTELTLSLEAKARRKALAKIHRLQKEDLSS
jgi:hypothetical protein